MGAKRGDEIHGERIVDGDASVLTALTIYKSGGFTAAGVAVARPIAADEFLCITDVIITLQSASDYSLLADSAAAGKYIVQAASDTFGGIVLHFIEPYVCPMGVTPKFSSSGVERNSCIIQGYVTK